MVLSRKVMLLWGGRAFFLCVLLLPVLEACGANRLWAGAAILIFLILALIFFFIRYKNCVFEATTQGIRIRTGILIHKSLYVKYRHIVAANRIYTPLSRRLNLSNPVIYCEGAAFLLPPLEDRLTQQIENNIKAEVRKYGP